MPNYLDIHEKNSIEMKAEIYELGAFITNYTFHNEAVKKFIESPFERFDLVIINAFVNEALLGFGYHYGAPIIAFSPVAALTWSSNLVGAPIPLSYVPHPFLNFSDQMGFLQRLTNIVFNVFDNCLHSYWFSIHNDMYEQHFPGKKKTPLYSLRQEVSLVFLNSHFTLNYPRPSVPNMIEIGGIQLNSVDSEPLPASIRNFLDSAKNGVIYFSMGTNIKSTQLPLNVQNALLNTFSKLKQKILWKWESQHLPEKPDNVFISDWFPQEDILAHPNVKLFITHGGFLSITEAIYHSVPIIGIPVHSDQHFNMVHAAHNGYGLTIDYGNVTESSMSWAINEVLENDRYKITISYIVH